MLCRTYKNGNITIQHEQFFDGDFTPNFHTFPLWITEHADGFDCHELRDFECWGNDYGAYPLEIFVNGELGLYYITPDDCERYAQGYMVRLRRDSLVPLFTLPSYYKTWRGKHPETGAKGTLYTLCDNPSEETKAELMHYGCTWHVVVAQYAPEIKRAAVFVPDGIPFDFE